MSDPRWTASTTAATFRSLTQNVLSAAPRSGACTIIGGRVDLAKAFERAFEEDVFLFTVAYAGMLLRDSELEDVAHYFVYSADDWARQYLG